jgi:IS30 family transposase
MGRRHRQLSLDDRCEIVGQANRGSFGLRATPGHREADLMLFARYGQAVSTVHERHSRLLLATRPPSKAAEGVANHLLELLQELPPKPSMSARCLTAIVRS